MAGAGEWGLVAPTRRSRTSI
ncbi:hypothetical protein STRIP9103_03697, partial [Streptomyces ipomoeae 91-03]